MKVYNGRNASRTLDKMLKSKNNFLAWIKFSLILFFVVSLIMLFAGLSSALGTFPEKTSDMKLILHFNNQSAYGENDTFVYDFSDGANNGSVYGDAKFNSTGGYLSDGAFEFDGVNDYIFVNGSNKSYGTVYNQTSFTVSYWVKINENKTSYTSQVDKGTHGSFSTPGVHSGWAFLSPAASDGCGILWEIYREVGWSSLVEYDMNCGEWNHIVGTFNGTQATLYINGLEDSTTTITTFSEWGNLSIGIGSNEKGDAGYFNGSIDDLIIFNRSLSDSEVWDLYYTYEGAFNDSLDCYYPYLDMDIWFNTTICQGQYNINSSGPDVFNIRSDDITLDCNGAEVFGNYSLGNPELDDDGVRVYYVNNVTVENCNLHNFYIPVNLKHSRDIELRNITTHTNAWGILVQNSSVRSYDLTINNTNSYKIPLYQTSDAYFYNTTLLDSPTGGIHVYGDSENILFENLTAHNTQSGGYAVYFDAGQNMTVNNFDCRSLVCMRGNDGADYFNAYDWVIRNSDGASAISTTGADYVIFDKMNFTNTNHTLILSYGTSNSVIKNSFFHNMPNGWSSTQVYLLRTGSNNTVINNSIIGQDIGIYVQESSDFKILNNTISNLSRNYDGWQLGIYVEGKNITNATNGLIQGNNITDSAMGGILIRGANNITIKDNHLDIMNDTERLAHTFGRDGSNYACGIYVTEDYEGWTGDSTESINDDLEKMRLYRSYNINITGNTYSDDTRCVLFEQGAINLTHDFSDVWNRSLQYPTYLFDRNNYYISNNWDHLTIKNASGVISNTSYIAHGDCEAYVAGQAAFCSYYIYGELEIFRNHTNLKNVNSSDLEVAFYDIDSGDTVYSITDNEYLFTSGIGQGDDFNKTLSQDDEVRIEDYGCVVPFSGISLTSSDTFCFGEYNLNVTHGGNGISINANNVVLDLGGSTIYGNWSGESLFQPTGIFSNDRLNVTVKNGKLKNYYYTMRILDTQNTKIQNMTFEEHRHLYLKNFTQSIITDSNFSNTTFVHIFLTHTIDEVVHDSNFTNNIFDKISGSSGIAISANARANKFLFKNNTCLQINNGACIELNNVTNSNILYNYFDGTTSSSSSSKNIYSIYGINNTYSYNNFTNDEGVRYGIWASTGEENPTISFNYFYNVSNNAPILSRGENTSIFNNTIILVDKAIFAEGGSGNIYNNFINRTITGFDGYSSGILVEEDAHDYNVFNNSINEVGTYGIIVRKSKSVKIEDNFISHINRSVWNSIGGAWDRNEYPCAIGSLELYKTYLGDNTEDPSDNLTNKIHAYNSSNIVINRNTFGSETQCYLRLQGAINVSHDLTNYNYYSFQFPTYLIDKDEFFIPRDVNEIIVLQDTDTFVNYGGNGYLNSLNNAFYKFLLTPNYNFFNNTNTSDSFDLRVFNKTKYLAFYNNNSIIGSTNIANNNGDFNVTLEPDQSMTVANDYNWTLGATRQNDPLFNGTYFNNTLDQSITVGIHGISTIRNAKFIDTSINRIFPGGLTISPTSYGYVY